MRRIFIPKLYRNRAVLLRILAAAAGMIVLFVCIFRLGAGTKQHPESSALCYPVEADGKVVQVEAAAYMASCGIQAAREWADENEAFRKAVCVMVNTNAWYLMQRSQAIPKDGYGMVWEEETAVRKMYGDALWEKWYDAAVQVQHQLICWRGKPILAAYHRSGFGITESAGVLWGVELPYLTWVRSGDMGQTDSRRTFRFTKEQFIRSWGGENAESLAGFRITSRSAAGNVLTVRWGEEEMTGAEFAKRFGLPSMVFAAEQDQDGMKLVCLGEGDGVGLSLYGAALLAQDGADHAQILQRYYPGTRLISCKKA